MKSIFGVFFATYCFYIWCLESAAEKDKNNIACKGNLTGIVPSLININFWLLLGCACTTSMSVHSKLNLKLNSRCAPLVLLYRGLRSTLTWVRVSGFDLDGRAAPVVLLYLGHPLSSHLVGVISGAHGDLVLDDTLDLQVVAAAAANRRRIEPLKRQSSDSEGCIWSFHEKWKNYRRTWHTLNILNL